MNGLVRLSWRGKYPHQLRMWLLQVLIPSLHSVDAYQVAPTCTVLVRLRRRRTHSPRPGRVKGSKHCKHRGIQPTTRLWLAANPAEFLERFQNTHRLRINFFFRWFRFSLRTWATAALTWAEGEHTWAEGEHAWTEPEHAWAYLSRDLSFLSTPWVSLRTIIWNLFWPPVCPGYSFLTELCLRISFCSLKGFLPELIWIPGIKEHVNSNSATIYRTTPIQHHSI